MKAKALILVLGMSLGLTAMAGLPGKTYLPQDNGSKYGKDSATCVMNLSLYREFYRQWKNSSYKNNSINDALKSWRWCFGNCPRASENMYVDGARMDQYRISKATGDQKQGLIDTLMMIYDHRIKYFPNRYGTSKSQEGYLLGRKGMALYKLNPKAIDKAYAILKQSVELEKGNSSGAVLIYYFRSIIKMAEAGKLEKVTIVDNYDQISDYIDANINKYKQMGNAGKLKEWTGVKDNIENTFEPYAKCDDLVRIYQKKFDTNPNDVDLLKKITFILDKKKCVESPLYFNATVNLYKAEPSPESAYLIGKIMLSNKKYEASIPYFKDAVKMKNSDFVDDAYMYMANAYRTLNKFPEARSMARKAIEVNPKNGQAYAFIGDLYAESAKKCGSNDLTSKVAYWVAVDEYIKAKKADPELTDAMNKRIAIYKAHFPTTETLFFYNLKAGDSYTVPCWINEKTIARSSN